MKRTAIFPEDVLNETSRDIPFTSPSSDCSFCHGLGWIRVFRGAYSGVTLCECAKQRTLKWKLSMIPSRFRKASFTTYIPIDEKQAAALQTIQTSPENSFYLYGAYGRGKTHLAVSQYRTLVEAGKAAAFMSVAELLRELRRIEIVDGYHSVILDRVRHAAEFHLFVDDVDKFKATEFNTDAFFDIFDTIYKRKLGLTVTTNFSLTELAQQLKLHPAVVRRFDDLCQTVEV